MIWSTRGESLINVVNRQQAKRAERLDPKGMWLVQDLPNVLTQTSSHRRTGETYIIRVCMQNVETPSFSRKGKADRKESR